MARDHYLKVFNMEALEFVAVNILKLLPKTLEENQYLCFIKNRNSNPI